MAKGVGEPVRMWTVRSLEEGGRSLTLPSPVSDLVDLAAPLEVRVRPFRGKQLGAETYAATVVKLGASGAELDTDCPLATFDAVQVVLPPQTGIVVALDSKVMMAVERATGRRTAFVRFGGLDWELRARLEALAGAGRLRV